MRDLGTMGEKAFGLWCSSEGLIANGSQIDRYGWDFYVEWPSEKVEDSSSLDMVPAPIECKIQVKATDTRFKKVAISLANMRRLVKAPMPAFLCVIEFLKKNDPQSAYLVHIGKDIIERTLKRLRQIESETNVNLRKKTLTISYNESHKLHELTGSALKSKIESYIPDGYENYIKEKMKILETIGFDSGAVEIKFSIRDKDPINKVFDLTLGLVDKLRVEDFSAYQKRFNIISQKPLIEPGGGILSITPSPTKLITIRFKENKYAPGQSFKARLFLSQLTNLVPQNYVKFRIESNLFEIIIKPFTNECIFNFELNDESNQTTLRELVSFLTFLNMLSKNRGQKFYIEIVTDQNLPPYQTAILLKKDLPDFEEALSLSMNTLEIAKQYKIDDTFRIKYKELLSNSKLINIFYQIIFEGSAYMKISFTYDSSFPTDVERAGGINLMVTEFGNYKLGCLLGIVGKPLIVEDRYEIVSTEKRFNRFILTDKNDSFDKDQIKDLAESMAKDMEEEGIFPIITEDIFKE
jgi:hypothetical protein